MMYLLFRADSFRKSALEEIGRAAPGYRLIDEQHNVFLADMKIGRNSILEDAKFIYRYFPVYSSSMIDKRNYIASIYGQLKGLKLNRKARIKLECFDINCKDGYSAKDIEVAIGGMMELDGFKIDIKDPEVLAYSVLLNSKCYSGYIKVSDCRNAFLDPFRVYKGKLVSRAEFKIMEAFDAFGIDVPETAVDIGAAPGGWSLFLARKGAAVIAVDGAELDCRGIRNAGITVRTFNAADRARVIGNAKPGEILHLKCRAREAIESLKGLHVGMVADDINTGGIESAIAVLEYAEIMDKDATLIMTVKCMRRNIGKYIKEVESLLESRFRIMQWKVLPHNRQEITLYAKKR